MTAVVISLFLATPALAVHPASPDDKEAIKILIGQAMKQQEILQDWEAASKKKAGQPPPPDLDQRIAHELASRPDLVTAAKERDKIMQRAIERTLVACDIVPVKEGKAVMPKGPSLNRAMRAYGYTDDITWSVSFQKPPPEIHTFGEDRWEGLHHKKRIRDFLTKGDVAEREGVTWADGSSVLWPNIDNSLTPAALARLLHHELNHFKLSTDPKYKNYGFYAREAIVLGRDLKAIDNFGFDKKEMGIWEPYLESQKRQAEGRMGFDDTVDKLKSFSERVRLLTFGAPPSDAPAIDGSVRGMRVSVTGLEAIRRRADELHASVEQEDEARRGRELYEQQEAERAARDAALAGSEPDPNPPYGNSGPAGPARAVAATPAVAIAMPANPAFAAAPAFDAWRTLKDLAARGCADPASVSDSELSVVWGKIYPMSYVAGAVENSGLGGCPRMLLDVLLGAASDSNYAAMRGETFYALAASARAAAAGHQPSYGADDESGRRPAPQPPAIPHCHYHPWCRE